MIQNNNFHQELFVWGLNNFHSAEPLTNPE